MSETKACQCGKQSLTPNNLVAQYLAQRGLAVKSFCFECQTLLEVVDGAVRVTPMVPAVPADAVRATRLHDLLSQLTDEWRNMYGFRRHDEVKAARELGLIETKVAGIVAGGDEVLWARLTDQGRTILAALDSSRASAAPAPPLGDVRLNDTEWNVVLGAFSARAEEDCVNPAPIIEALHYYRQAGDALFSAGAAPPAPEPNTESRCGGCTHFRALGCSAGHSIGRACVRISEACSHFTAPAPPSLAEAIRAEVVKRGPLDREAFQAAGRELFGDDAFPLESCSTDVTNHCPICEGNARDTELMDALQLEADESQARWMLVDETLAADAGICANIRDEARAIIAAQSAAPSGEGE